MGRELKRVALDFNWPIGEIWHGYLNPYSTRKRECPLCHQRRSLLGCKDAYELSCSSCDDGFI
jgi:hypothetical protein